MSNLTDALIAAKLVGGSGGSGGGSGSGGIFHVHNVEGEYDDTTGDVITPPHLSATYAEIAAEVEAGNLVWLDDPQGVMLAQEHNEGEPYKVTFRSPALAYPGYSLLVAPIVFEASTADGYLVVDFEPCVMAEDWSFHAFSVVVVLTVEAYDTNEAGVVFSLPQGRLETLFYVEQDTETGADRLVVAPQNVFGDFRGFSMDYLSDMQSFLEYAIYRLFGVWGEYESLSSNGEFRYSISGLQYDKNTGIVSAPDCIFKRVLDGTDWEGTL